MPVTLSAAKGLATPKHAPLAIGFTDLDHPSSRLMVFVAEWNTCAHPFNWSTKSEALVMAKYQVQPLLVPAAEQQTFRFFFLRLLTSNSQALSAR